MPGHPLAAASRARHVAFGTAGACRGFRWAALLILLALAVGLARGASGATARQADDVNVAGVVVDFGDGEVAYALVPFAEESVSGIELLHRSGLPLLTVDFGAMGEGVCMIQDTGCDVGPCRARLCQSGDPDSAFWQYAQPSASGDWSVAALGPGSSDVGNGDVEGWFWTGDTPDGTALTLDAIAAEMDVDLATFRIEAAHDLESVIAVPSGDEDASAFDRWAWLAGVGIVGGVVVLGGWTVARARRGRQP